MLSALCFSNNIPWLISYKIRHLFFFLCLLLDVKEKADQQASVSSSEGSKKTEVTGQEELKFQSPFDFSALSSVLNVFHPSFCYGYLVK